MTRALIITAAIAVLFVPAVPCQAQFGLGGGGRSLPAEAQPAMLRAHTHDVERVKLGQELFVRDWTKHKPEHGDGIGPMYNAVSCVACHQAARIGGAGRTQHNVDMVSVVSPKPTKDGFSKRIAATLKHIHPDLSATSLSVTVHKVARGAKNDSRDGEYAKFRHEFMRVTDRSRRRLASSGLGGHTKFVQPRFRREGPIVLEFSQRSTPALFGAGLIDQVPDSALIEVARHQKDRVPGISGRVPQTNSGAVGRFGWRGQVRSLHDFVLGACVNELGLQVSGLQAEPQNPAAALARLKAGKSAAVKNASPMNKADLTENETHALTAFISSLAPPVPLNGITLQQSEQALAGERLFEKAGCSHCHVQTMGPAQHIYSDLLLHDMGPGLADAVSAIPEIDAREVPVTSGYYGGTSIELLVNVTTNVRQEWRTPPLWGLRDSPPYLHDGRAVSLDEAIRMHGGEAATAARKFRALKAGDRDKVIAFLNTLAPPGAQPQSLLPFRSVGGGLGSGGFFSSGGGRRNRRGGFSAFAGSGVFSVSDQD